jgi:K+-transporting ATPase ATPase C chain
MDLPPSRDNTLRHIGTSVVYTVLSVITFGLVFPFIMTAVAQLTFPWQANGSMIYVRGRPVGSAIIGQLWTKPQYFHGRPSAAGKGYDPTSTGGTNLGPTSKKLIDSTKAAMDALRKENPDTTTPVPMDLVTSSASGIDPDISPQAALYQAPRVAKARHVSTFVVVALINRHLRGRTLGFMGEQRVNVLELNLALDGVQATTKP